jgi:DNA-binding LytR/AlgR family response regulator
MSDTTLHETAEARAAERRADRRALLLIGGFLLASLAVRGFTLRTEAIRHGSPVTWQETWLNETTSHLAILLVAPLLPWVLDRFPLAAGQWRRALPGHAAGSLVFSVLHVALMFGARTLLFPAFVGVSYRMNLFAPAHFAYELQKDVLTYAMLMVGYVLMRSVEQGRLEAASALQAARRNHQLTLKSGTAAIVVDSRDVLWARAAGNYVEVATPGKTHLARMTLSRLEELLAAAGDRHLRLHRSHVVNLDHVREVTPTGEGDVRVTLSDGTVAPGSRRYRDGLLAAIEGNRSVRDAARP